ncbi:Uncharacterised protein [Vibrio cholerae]|nr:Uncharacterised protein [Vibrio cholerae]
MFMHNDKSNLKPVHFRFKLVAVKQRIQIRE